MNTTTIQPTYIGFASKKGFLPIVGTGVYLSLSPTGVSLHLFEGGHTMLPGIVLSKDVFDVRLFGHAWIWNRSNGWRKRL